MSTINFKKLKDYVFYSFILLSILFALIPFIFLETYEMSLSMKIVFDNIVLFGLFSVVLSIIFYDNIFLSTKTKNKILYIIIKGFKIIFGSSLMFILIFGLISGVLLSVNSYVGNQEIIKVKSKVISIKETNSNVAKTITTSLLKFQMKNGKLNLKLTDNIISEKYLTGNFTKEVLICTTEKNEDNEL